MKKLDDIAIALFEYGYDEEEATKVTDDLYSLIKMTKEDILNDSCVCDCLGGRLERKFERLVKAFED